MHIDITQDSFDTLADYATIPIAFEVREVLDLATMTPRPVGTRYVKDYDVDGDSPLTWPTRFDLSNWALLVARVDGRRVGGATVAFDTPDLHMLGDRGDVALIWDLRVAPDLRGRGVGTALFRAAERWAQAKRCTELEVETQDINVPACWFYARMGCRLRAVHRDAYVDFPNEVQLLWSRRLTPG